MAFLTGSDRTLAEAISRLAYCNPFLPERIECERQALGDAFVPGGTLWHATGDPEPPPNVFALRERAGALSERLAARLAEQARPGAEDLQLYEDVVIYMLFARYDDDFYGLIDERAATAAVGFYRRFRRTSSACSRSRAPGSWPTATCRISSPRSSRSDARFTTSSTTSSVTPRRSSVCGPRSGSRSSPATCVAIVAHALIERAAIAIGLARYIPFDPEKQAFVENFAGSFYALNPSALSPTLIESELFGHRRGAFTGAVQDRAGWLEVCRPLGTVFLDEIGELEPALQVKLLRVLQTRTFQRLGDTRDRRFHGKIIAATNRSLPSEMASGRFRQDLYYRLCSDIIVTPSLAEQLDAEAGERQALVRFLARRVA